MLMLLVKREKKFCKTHYCYLSLSGACQSSRLNLDWIGQGNKELINAGRKSTVVDHFSNVGCAANCDKVLHFVTMDMLAP